MTVESRTQRMQHLQRSSEAGCAVRCVVTGGWSKCGNPTDSDRLACFRIRPQNKGNKMKRKLCQRCVKLDCVCAKQGIAMTTMQKGYTARWKKFRERLFRKKVMQGLAKCADCGLAFGSQSPHADHIIPIQNENDPLFYCEDNIQFLHPGCHSRKTASDARAGFSRRKSP